MKQGPPAYGAAMSRQRDGEREPFPRGRVGSAPRVLLVHNRCQLGGIETVVLQLLNGFRARGLDAEFWVAEGKSYPAIDGLRPMYPRVFSRLEHTRAGAVVRALAPRRVWTERVFRSAASSRFDIVHIHGFDETFAPFEALAEVAASKPVVFTVHGYWNLTGGCPYPLDCGRYRDTCGDCPQADALFSGGPDRSAENLERKARLMGQIKITAVAPSEAMLRRLVVSRVGRRWDRVRIPNGVDPKAFRADRKRDRALRVALGLEPSRPCVLLTCRDFRDRYKGFALAAEALRSVADLAPQIVLIGAGADEAAAALPEGMRVILPGYVASREVLATYCEAAEVYLFPSLQENFPCAVLEAMAAGCCVVAAPGEGVTEMVEDGRSGFLAARMEGGALGEALRGALRDPEMAARMGMAARDRVVQEFSEERMIREHIGLYERILGR